LSFSYLYFFVSNPSFEPSRWFAHSLSDAPGHHHELALQRWYGRSGGCLSFPRQASHWQASGSTLFCSSVLLFISFVSFCFLYFHFCS
jgi:hypothetical protein